MKVLMLSKEGDGCGLAHQLSKEGHDVFLWIQDARYHKVLRGIVNRVDSWRPLVGKVDLIICDMVGFSKYSDTLKSRVPVLGCDAVMDLLELDRLKAYDVLERLGYTLPVSKCYTVKEAKNLEWSNPAGYVVKPCGNLSSGKTMLCETEEIYQWSLSQFDTGQEMLVQEVVAGVEVSTEGWWNGTEWIQPFNHTFEEKRLMPGGVGRMTGCQGNVVMMLKKPDKLVREVILPLTPILAKTSYRGPVDVNCIVTSEKAYTLELTCRFGYDALEGLMYGIKGGVGTFLFDLAMGVAKAIPYHSMDYLGVVRATVPPYPETEFKDPCHTNMPVCGLGNMHDIYLCDVYKQGKDYKTAGADGVVLKVASNGRDVRETMRRCYKRLSDVKVLDLQYRNDIGKRVDSDLNNLRTWGWIL